MKTEDLIAKLAVESQTPVRRLRPPSLRLAGWLALSLPWVVVAAMLVGLRPDLIAKLGESRWLLEQSAALATAVIAAMAAFCAGVPGRPRWEHVVPLAPLSLWLGTIGVGCLQDWVAAGPQGLSFQPDWECLPGIITVGFVPGIAMALMLRRVAPVARMTAVGLGGLAAAALADFGLRFFHTQDASAMVLVWQIGTVALVAALSAAFAPRLVRWRHLASS